jgi:hypothetical protein
VTEVLPVADMEKIVSLCQRRGFVFPSSEIYGGLSGCWDYGPLGVEMKRNIKARGGGATSASGMTSWGWTAAS